MDWDQIRKMVWETSTKIGRNKASKHRKGHTRSVADYQSARKRRNKEASRMRAVQRRLDKQCSTRAR